MLLHGPPQENEIVIDKADVLEDALLMHFISAGSNRIIRDVYAVKTKDENKKECFVLKCSTRYDIETPIYRIIGVAHSSSVAEEMGYNFIKEKTEEVRKKYYPNYTLVDKIQLF